MRYQKLSAVILVTLALANARAFADEAADAAKALVPPQLPADHVPLRDADRISLSREAFHSNVTCESCHSTKWGNYGQIRQRAYLRKIAALDQQLASTDPSTEAARLLKKQRVRDEQEWRRLRDERVAPPPPPAAPLPPPPTAP